MSKKQFYLKIFANILVLILLIISFKTIVPFMISLFLPFIIGYIIALLANPIIKFMESKMKINRKISALFVVVGLLSGISFIIYKIIRKIILMIKNINVNIDQISDFIMDLVDKTKNIITKIPNVDNELLNEILTKCSKVIFDFIKNFTTSILDNGTNFISNIPLFLIIFVISIVSAYIISAENINIFKNIRLNERFTMIKKEVFDVLINYTKGQLIIMFIIFTIIAIGLAILNVNNYIIIALLIAFIDLIPVLGTGTVIGPWIIVCLLYQDFKMVIGLGIIYIVTLLTRQILQPKILGNSVGIPFLPTIILMFVGFKLYGVLGMLFSIPVGIIFYRLYKLEFFANYIKCIKIIIQDIKQLLKINL